MMTWYRRLRISLAMVRKHLALRAGVCRAKARCEALEEENDRHNEAGRHDSYELNRLRRRNKALMSAISVLLPEELAEKDLQALYECVEEYLDPEGFTLYHTAAEITGFDISSAFPFEDARGQFEEADGHQLMRYLEAYCFGVVDWDVVPGTGYERASLGNVDRSTPKYQAFRWQLYDAVLRRLGFENLLPPRQEVQRGEGGDTVC